MNAATSTLSHAEQTMPPAAHNGKAAATPQHDGDIYRAERAGAAAALADAARRLPQDVRDAVSPTAWTRRFPWSALGVAATTGLAAGVLGTKAVRSWRNTSTNGRTNREAPPFQSREAAQPRETKSGSRRPGRSSIGGSSWARTLQSTLFAGVAAHSTTSAVKEQQRPVGGNRPAPRAAQPPERPAASAPRKKSSPPPSDRSWWNLLKQTYQDWSEDNASRLAAALAYYTVFSIAPILVIVLAVLGLALGAEAAQGGIHDQLVGFLGEDGAKGVEDMIAASRKPAQGITATVVGVIILLFGASGVFAQLKDAMNVIWEVKAPATNGIWGFIRTRFLSFAMVLAIGFVLLVSLVLSATLSGMAAWAGNLVPGPDGLLHVANFVVSAAVISLLFALLFKYLPDAHVAWRDVWIGAVATAVMFSLGKLAFGLYLGHSSVGSSYGAAGSLVIVLLWAYYSAQILFFGAEFTQAYARMYGSRIRAAAAPAAGG